MFPRSPLGFLPLMRRPLGHQVGTLQARPPLGQSMATIGQTFPVLQLSLEVHARSQSQFAEIAENFLFEEPQQDTSDFSPGVQRVVETGSEGAIAEQNLPLPESSLQLPESETASASAPEAIQAQAESNSAAQPESADIPDLSSNIDLASETAISELPDRPEPLTEQSLAAESEETTADPPLHSLNLSDQDTPVTSEAAGAVQRHSDFQLLSETSEPGSGVDEASVSSDIEELQIARSSPLEAQTDGIPDIAAAPLATEEVYAGREFQPLEPTEPISSEATQTVQRWESSVEVPEQSAVVNPVQSPSVQPISALELQQGDAEPEVPPLAPPEAEEEAAEPGKLQSLQLAELASPESSQSIQRSELALENTQHRTEENSVQPSAPQLAAQSETVQRVETEPESLPFIPPETEQKTAETSDSQSPGAAEATPSEPSQTVQRSQSEPIEAPEQPPAIQSASVPELMQQVDAESESIRSTASQEGLTEQTQELQTDHIDLSQTAQTTQIAAQPTDLDSTEAEVPNISRLPEASAPETVHSSQQSLTQSTSEATSQEIIEPKDITLQLHNSEASFASEVPLNSPDFIAPQPASLESSSNDRSDITSSFSDISTDSISIPSIQFDRELEASVESDSAMPIELSVEGQGEQLPSTEIYSTTDLSPQRQTSQPQLLQASQENTDQPTGEVDRSLSIQRQQEEPYQTLPPLGMTEPLVQASPTLLPEAFEQNLRARQPTDETEIRNRQVQGETIARKPTEVAEPEPQGEQSASSRVSSSNDEIPDQWNSLADLIVQRSHQNPQSSQQPWQEAINSLDELTEGSGIQRFGEELEEDDSAEKMIVGSPVEPDVEPIHESTHELAPEPAVHTIQRQAKGGEDTIADEDLAKLARKIYSRLRDQFEIGIGVERQGSFTIGHQAWLGNIPPPYSSKANKTEAGDSPEVEEIREISFSTDLELEQLTSQVYSLLRLKLEIDHERYSYSSLFHFHR